jgi:hypothetical protein
MAARKIAPSPSDFPFATEHAPASKHDRWPLYLALGGLRQLISDIAGDVPAGDPNLSRDLYDDLQQTSLRFHICESHAGYGTSAAEIETLGRHEIHLGELVRDLSPTAGNKMSPFFRMLLLETQSSEEIALFRELAQRFHGAMNHYRCTHSPIKHERGRPSEEAMSRLVERELPAIFAKHFGFLEAYLKPQEFAQRRNLFVVRATELLCVPINRAARKKRSQRLRNLAPKRSK